VDTSEVKLKFVAALGLTILTLGACGGGDVSTGDSDKEAPPAVSTGAVEPSRFGSVTDLRDAAVEAGYVCATWEGDNVVTLAAESGTCDDQSVLSTYATDVDLQTQLDQEKEMSGLLTENGIEPEPVLVGPNWLFKAPEAPGLRDFLGGVLIGAREE
jgi:hypothetical protein